MNVRETIKKTVAKHLESGGQAFGQCLTAVGWVGGTLPEKYEDEGMVELSMADVAGGAIVVGTALRGVRPIYVIRYQGFNWYNSVSIINYACKSKEMWGVPCPLFVRSIAMEGSIGPVAGGSHHSLYYRMPGVKIVSPMTPQEYEDCYDDFMSEDEVYYVSEHRGSYDNSRELRDIEYNNPDIVLFPISITRFAAQKASYALREQGIKAAVYHQVTIKPSFFTSNSLNALTRAGKGIVLDDDYVNGVASSFAADLMLETGAKVTTMGLEDRTAGFAEHFDNLPPSKEDIIRNVRIITQN